MTCLIGLHDGNVVHMGADDAITSELIHTNGRKIVCFPNGLIAGFAGSLVAQQIVTHEKGFLRDLKDLDDDQEVNSLFLAIHKLSETPLKGVTDPQHLWTFMLLAKGSSLVWMANAGGWYRVKDEFRCVGDGSLLATGAMSVLRGAPPRERIERSIEAASKYVPGVSKMTMYETTAPPAAGLSKAPPATPGPTGGAAPAAPTTAAAPTP